MSAGPRHATLRLGDAGRIELQAGTELVALTPAGRAARAGDGLAAQVTRSVLSADDAGLSADVGTARVVGVGGGPLGDLVERGIDVDQTHQSVIVSGRYVVKLVSRWGAADRAARLLQSLSQAGSADIPKFHGHLDWDHPTLGRGTVALVSDYVPDAEDGWTWAVADVVAHLGQGAPAPDWPAVLGTVTARLHTALAADAVEPTTGYGVVLRARAARTLQHALQVSTGSARTRLHNRVQVLTAAIDSIPDHPSGPLFAGHGDLHVGQVLRAAGGRYWVVDLDGDPQLDAAARDRPEPAAVDVAHLLVSVAQVAAVAQRHGGGPDPAAVRWSVRARADLLAAYRAELARNHRADLLDERALAGLCAEQVLRELIYAVKFLPRWTYAGEGTLVADYPVTPDIEEEPWIPPAFGPT